MDASFMLRDHSLYIQAGEQMESMVGCLMRKDYVLKFEWERRKGEADNSDNLPSYAK